MSTVAFFSLKKFMPLILFLCRDCFCPDWLNLNLPPCSALCRNPSSMQQPYVSNMPRFWDVATSPSESPAYIIHVFSLFSPLSPQLGPSLEPHRAWQFLMNCLSSLSHSPRWFEVLPSCFIFSCCGTVQLQRQKLQKGDLKQIFHVLKMNQIQDLGV